MAGKTTTRRSTRPDRTAKATTDRNPRKSTAQKERENHDLIPIGGLWDKETKSGDQYYMGSISRRPDPETGLTDIDRLREVLDNLEDDQSLTLLCFYNSGCEKNQAAPVYNVSVSVYDGNGGGNGKSRRGGRR